MAHVPERSTLPLWRSESLERPAWLETLVTTRHGGESAAPYDTLNLGLATGDDPACVHANRARLRRSLGLEDARWVQLSQVHGTRIWTVPDGAAAEGDGLYTTATGVVLVVGVADCVPVFIWNVRRPQAALVHAGWRGTAAGILGKALDHCLERGAAAVDLRVLLGPSIGPCCYRVGAEVASQFPASATWAARDATHLDLRAANRDQALARGLAPHQIDAAPPCTACCRDQFFSHRREGPRTGRMWALLWMHPAPAS